jgi:hypothetical protein
VNKKLAEKWKEVVEAYFEFVYYAGIFLEGRRKNTSDLSVTGL